MDAIISKCGRYRYTLTREISGRLGVTPLSALFVMLNPSTADAETDDPTIRRCVSFAQRLNCSQLIVANLYALRSTDPTQLWSADDPIGPENDQHLERLMAQCRQAICAWGGKARPERVQQFMEMAARLDVTLWCLGTTKAGEPRHPLYLRKDARLMPWKWGEPTWPTTPQHSPTDVDTAEDGV